MPLPIVALKPESFPTEEKQVIYQSVQTATLSVFNTHGGMKSDNVVVMTEQVVTKHDWFIHVRITLKRDFFRGAKSYELKELKDYFVTELRQLLAKSGVNLVDDKIKAMIELVDRY